MDKDRIYEILKKAYFSEEKNEKEIIENLPVILRGVKIFVDVGASLGQYTFFANKYIREGQIFAVEPDPIRFEELESSCHKWESLSSNKLTALRVAVCDKNGQTKFYITNSNISGGLFEHDIHQSVLTKSGLKGVDWNGIIVDCFRLDTLFQDRSPDLVKVDVEGAELRVLKGATRILKEGKAKFLIEVHGGLVDPEGQKRPDEVHKFMNSFGYHSFSFYGGVLFVKLGLFKSGFLWFKNKLRAFLLEKFMITRG